MDGHPTGAGTPPLSEIDVVKAQEEVDINIMNHFMGRDIDLRTQLVKLKSHYRKKKTDQELVADYKFAITIFDQYRSKTNWEVSLVSLYAFLLW